ncbi:VOC family protein [Maricurvus nonylphenolicus]|uniref:VOC family protein n=1 Tax=Maricurvus nonylphenolicus TaxID=1008307 RepID=UPI0036F3B66B
MSDPICKIDDIVFLRFTVQDLESQKEYLHHFGMRSAFEENDTIYFKGTGPDPYCYIASKGDENKFVGTGYRVGSRKALESLAESFGVEIFTSSEPGGGEYVSITDPDGLVVEVYCGLNRSSIEASSVPRLNAGVEKTRDTNDLQRFGKASDEWVVEEGEWKYQLTSKVFRLGHIAIVTENPEESIAWYQNTLGFLISDNLLGPDGARLGAFMRADQGDKPVDHHIINITGAMDDRFAGTFGHGGFELTESVDDLMAGHYHMKTVDKYFHEWGVGRHLLGSQMYDYWRDPNGFTLEHWTDGDLLDASVAPENVPAKNFVLAQYGPLVPSTFGLSMPSDEVSRYRENNPSFTEILKDFE